MGCRHIDTFNQDLDATNEVAEQDTTSREICRES